MTSTTVDHATPLAPGASAPDFALLSTPDQKVSLSEFRGQPVILAFYPEDWSPVCSDQMALYQEVLPEFQKFNAELLGISVDGIWCHLAFAKDRNLHFPLLADFEPKGEVARAYQVYRTQDGTSERALFVIDADGLVALELRLAGGREPRSRRHPPRSRIARRRGSDMTTTQWVAELTMPVSEDRDHIAGPAGAPVTLVEYGDYECPYCGAAYPIVKEVQARMGDSLRFVFRNFPISTAHPRAEQAAEAAEAADAQSRFWPMHDMLYEHQSRLGEQALHGYAAELGLDVAVFDKELAEHAYADRVHEDFLSGVRSGVNGTPTFYINGIRHDDSYELETMLAALERAAS